MKQAWEERGGCYLSLLSLCGKQLGLGDPDGGQ